MTKELIIEDLAIGDGKAAESGSRIVVHYTGKLEDGTVFVAPVAVVHVQSVGDDGGGVILVGFPILFRLLEITLVDEVIAHSERKELEGFIGRTEGEVPALHASQFVLGSEVKSGFHGELFGEILLGAERRP